MRRGRLELAHLDPGRIALVQLRGVVLPDADEVVTAAGDEATHGGGVAELAGRVVCEEDAWPQLGAPADGRDTTFVCGDQVALPRVVGAVRPHGHVAIRGGGREDKTEGVGGPAEGVHGSLVAVVVPQLGPHASALLLPHDDAVVVAARRQHGAKLGVRPSHLPHWTFMALQSGAQGLLVVCYLVNLNRAIGRSRRKSLSIIVELRIMLGGEKMRNKKNKKKVRGINIRHMIITRWCAYMEYNRDDD